MARIRTIKPEFWSDEKLAKVSRDARLLFMGLLNQAEDHGVARANPAYLKGQIFPYDDVSSARVGRWLTELEAQKLVKRFGHDGQVFVFIINFKKHQKIDRPSPSNLPSPPIENTDELGKSSTSPRRALDEPSLLEGKGKEGKGKEAAEPARQPSGPESMRLLWNECKAPEQPEWVEVSKKRRELAEARLKERPLRGERSWEEVFRRLAASSFARGLASGSDGRSWIAGPKFFLQPDAATKVLEGTYDDRKSTPKKKSTNELFEEIHAA